MPGVACVFDKKKKLGAIDKLKKHERGFANSMGSREQLFYRLHDYDSVFRSVHYVPQK